MKKVTAKHPKEYEIRSFEDFISIVNEKNADMLCGNFYGVIKQFLQMKKKFPSLEFKGFTWVDDGKIEVRGAKITMNVDFGNDKD